MLELRSRRGRLVVAATVLGSGVATLDATVVNIALPAIGRALHSGVSTLQWVSTGYTLTLASFLLLGGALGDRWGRRRVFRIGLVWFAVASAACGLAPDAGVLIATRALQGVGGALLTPGSLAILQASFTPDDRGRAIGAWSGLGGLVTVAGPLVGGTLLAVGSWRLVFLINLPLVAAVLVLSGWIPESRHEDPGSHLDVVGAVLAVAWLTGATFALIEGPGQGWASPLVVAGLVVAVAGLAAFLLVERRSPNPLLPLTLFADRQFSAVNVLTFSVYAALGGSLFLLPTELQVVSGYSALDSGLATLPITVIMLALSARSGRLAARIGPRLQLSAGPLLVGAGLVLLRRATGGAYVADVLPAVLVFGFGLAVTVAPLTATVMDAAPADRAGVASAVNNDVARAAGLVAVAVLPPLAGLAGRGALRAAELAPGFQVAVTVAGVLCAAGGVLGALTIRNPGAGAGAGRDDCAVPHVAVDRPAPPTGGSSAQRAR